jgi:hypothetical protein
LVTDNGPAWHRHNGLRGLALPTSGGDSYTSAVATMAANPDWTGPLVDGIKPTRKGGGCVLRGSERERKGATGSELRLTIGIVALDRSLSLPVVAPCRSSSLPVLLESARIAPCRSRPACPRGKAAPFPKYHHVKLGVFVPDSRLIYIR